MINKTSKIPLILVMFAISCIFLPGVFQDPYPWGWITGSIYVATLLLGLWWIQKPPKLHSKQVFWTNTWVLVVELVLCGLVYIRYHSTSFSALLILIFQGLLILCVNASIYLSSRFTPAVLAKGSFFVEWKCYKALCLLSLPLCIGLCLLFHYLDQAETETLLPLARYIEIGGSFGGIIFIVLLPSWFIKQDADPSYIQKECRTVIFFVWDFHHLITPSWYPHRIDSKLFKYWLSHPGIPITNELIEQLTDIDPYTFDWQNPTEWPLIEDLKL